MDTEQAQEYLNHLITGGPLILRPGPKSPSYETELLMEITDASSLFIYQIRYPAPHTPQVLAHSEALKLLKEYNGTVTPYA